MSELSVKQGHSEKETGQKVRRKRRRVFSFRFESEFKNLSYKRKEL